MTRNNESGDNGDTWIKLGDIGTFATPWMTIVGENLLDDNGNELEYWRVQKDDSVVILTCQYEDDNQTTGKPRLVFPKPMYRPGVGYSTLDFPGGRIPRGGRAMDVIPNILRRELQIDPDSDILSLEALNGETEGWLVNSSFSNQKLFGFCAILRDNPSSVSSDTLTYDAEKGSTDLDELLSRDLSCLQCRMVLMEWLRRRANV